MTDFSRRYVHRKSTKPPWLMSGIWWCTTDAARSARITMRPHRAGPTGLAASPPTPIGGPLNHPLDVARTPLSMSIYLDRQDLLQCNTGDVYTSQSLWITTGM